MLFLIVWNKFHKEKTEPLLDTVDLLAHNWHKAITHKYTHTRARLSHTNAIWMLLFLKVLSLVPYAIVDSWHKFFHIRIFPIRIPLKHSSHFVLKPMNHEPLTRNHEPCLCLKWERGVFSQSTAALFGSYEMCMFSCKIPHLPVLLVHNWVLLHLKNWSLHALEIHKDSAVLVKVEHWEVPSPLNVYYSSKLVYEQANVKHNHVNGKDAHSLSLALQRRSFNTWLVRSSDLGKKTRKTKTKQHAHKTLCVGMSFL